KAESLVVEEPAGLGNEDWAAEQPSSLFRHCDQHIALGKNEPIRNLAAVILLLLATVAIPAGLVEISWSQQDVVAAVGEKLALESEAVFDVAEFREPLLHPPWAALGEDGLEVTLEEGAGVLEVLFGVVFGGGDTP